ncbi:hypothetical protein [Mesobacillus foraminis]|uniref:Uncharacterized protein n=1 Tax=Mesobacillus foraminis TaxID=279826 RepID=A0A4R2B4N8_9BACI|nr:hypothetical protein [Mesobacillus foraminis]TCN21203.1 hypothetical protein EV146_113127 [Mesobacillus foraminis]
MVAKANLRTVLKQAQNGYTLKRSDTMLREEIEKFDNAFPDGVFAFPPSPEAPKVRIRALDKYCREKGITPRDLSKEEMEQFLVY